MLKLLNFCFALKGERTIKPQIRLGKILGIEIGLHYSWLIIAVLISLSLVQYFGNANPDWSRNTVWLMSVTASLLFFITLVLHELSHAMVARSNDLPVSSITLFALGGLAQIEKEPPDAKTEFWLGIVGPIASLSIGMVCLGSAWAFGWLPFSEPENPLLAMLVWLGYINVALAVFNMIPGFPMDGGRVLRSIIWRLTGNAGRATKVASLISQFVAFVFIVFGLMLFFRGAGFSGLWIAFIGWFLLSAAKTSYAQESLKERLAGVQVSDLMNRECPVVEGRINLETLVEDKLLKTGQRCFVVVENGSPVGLITAHEVKNIERRLWKLTVVSDAMIPLENIQVVEPCIPVIEALGIIGRENVNQLPVVSNGLLEGIISRDRIINYLLTREELNL
ncbi:MAG: site-2 protease family protein [Pyrinomonadaceae bacterium]|nr:site-2 protease family protein [Pyrinomonadaceae bacterium]